MEGTRLILAGALATGLAMAPKAVQAKCYEKRAHNGWIAEGIASGNGGCVQDSSEKIIKQGKTVEEIRGQSSGSKKETCVIDSRTGKRVCGVSSN